MKCEYEQWFLGVALVFLSGAAAMSRVEDKPKAAPVGVVKATVFLGEFQ